MSAAQRKPIAAEGETPNRSSVQQLMHDMGARSFDPMPPDQYLSYLDRRYSPAQRLWAWLLAKTIRRGHRSPYAVDERGNDLYLKHAAAELQMDPGNARHAWRQLENEGRAKVEGRRLCLCGTVKPKADFPANKKRSGVCTSTFPPYIANQINKLNPEVKAEFFARYEQEDKRQSAFTADLVAGVRTIFDLRKDTVLSEFGIKKKREKKRRDPKRSLAPLLLPVVAEYVQTSIPGFVQTSPEGAYTAKNGSVQTPPSLLSSESREVLRTAAASSLVDSAPPRAMAAAAGANATATKSKTAEAFPFPLALAKARASFPTVDEPFVLKLAAIARAERPAITDAELADCVVKKPSQKSEGLFLSTVGPRAHALNEYHAAPEAAKPTEYVSAEEWEATYGGAK